MTKRNAQITRNPPKKMPDGSMEAIGNPITVRGKLALLGWPSLMDWAIAHGYTRCMAYYVVKTWGMRTDRRQPHGGIARQLMNDLRETLANGKRPEQMPVANGE